MHILITGAAGFLGRRLVQALIAGPPGLPQVSRIVAADVAPGAVGERRVVERTGSITNPDFVRSVVEPGTDIVYHLAAVVSGQSEAEFDTGMQVNVDATRSLLEACRRLPRAPRVVFASSIAVFGGPLPDVVPENVALRPQSSYGAEKAVAELLVSEYSRRGFIDGVACRLATVAVRPGRPNSALSSFVSGIIREPLAGEVAVCPVPLETPVWISSPRTVIRNLVHAAGVPGAALEGARALNLPGLRATAGQMLDSLERLAGPSVRSLVHCKTDDRVAPIVASWPGALDATRALRLGFTADRDVDDVVREYMSGMTSGRTET
jgi:D-erythronate 2-dehydrogenase